MPTYIIASSYFEHETDLTTGKYTADNPFEACLADCMAVCKIPRHEAATYFSEHSYQLVMWELRGQDVARVTYHDINWPWKKISDLKKEIARINQALATAAEMEFLLTLPTMPDGQSIDLQPARDYLSVKEEELELAERRWREMQAPPEGNKELRSIQVDTDA